MWKKNLSVIVAVCVATLSTIRPVLADQVDEERMLLESKINEACINKQLSSKDSRIIRQEMAEFKKKKTSMFGASGDRFTVEDDDVLYKGLGRISQDFETMKARKSSEESDNKKITKTSKSAH